MKRVGRNVVTLMTVLLLVLIAACAPTPKEITPTPGEVTPQPILEPTPEAEQGIIEIRVTDPPPAEVKSAVVYLTNIEVHKVSDNVSDNVGKWMPIIGVAPSFDLMVVAEVAAVLGSANITAGSFTQIRMDVDRVEVVTVAGENITAEVPSEKLKIVGAFNVGGGRKTVLTLDFDGSKSLIITGKGKALVRPVVKLLVEKSKGD